MHVCNACIHVCTHVPVHASLCACARVCENLSSTYFLDTFSYPAGIMAKHTLQSRDYIGGSIVPIVQLRTPSFELLALIIICRILCTDVDVCLLQILCVEKI